MIRKYSKLIGWTETELANHLLAETLSWFDDSRSGYTEAFLGAIHYRDRASTDRALSKVSQIVRKQYNGKLPASFKSEIRQLPDGRFNLTAKVIGKHGELLQIC